MNIFLKSIVVKLLQSSSASLPDFYKRTCEIKVKTKKGLHFTYTRF